jgi:prepilin-type N-terminal cleavage/methylation domain-containing protein
MAIKTLSRAGFTMVELLISIAIFIMITGLVIVNFRAGQYRDELTGAAGLVQATLREMQTAANSGTVTPTPCPGVTTPQVPPSGYGVYFATPSTMIEFADCETMAPKTYSYVSGNSNFIVVRTITLSSNVEFSSLQPGGPLNTVFDPFVETVKVNGASSDAIITVRHLRGTQATLTVRLNAATGQVFIQ